MAKVEVDMTKLRNFSESDVQSAEIAFQIFEKNRPAGSVADLKAFIESSGLHLKYPTVFSIISKISETNPKGLNFKSFIESFQTLLGNRETKPGAKRLFETLDINSLAHLDSDRLASIAQEIGVGVSKEDLEYLIRSSYNSSTGNINLEQFQKRLSKLQKH